MDPEHAVALALLHGCKFYCFGGACWYVEKDSKVHAVERIQKEKSGKYFHTTKEELAISYCKFYRLGEYTNGA